MARKKLSPLLQFASSFYLVSVIGAILVVILGLAIFVYKNRKSTHISGVITDVETLCEVDGTCRVKVDDVWVITLVGEGMTDQVHGNTYDDTGERVGFYPKDKIGESIEGYVKETNDGYTLYGNSDYYLKIVQ